MRLVKHIRRIIDRHLFSHHIIIQKRRLILLCNFLRGIEPHQIFLRHAGKRGNHHHDRDVPFFCKGKDGPVILFRFFRKLLTFGTCADIRLFHGLRYHSRFKSPPVSVLLSFLAKRKILLRQLLIPIMILRISKQKSQPLFLRHAGPDRIQPVSRPLHTVGILNCVTNINKFLLLHYAIAFQHNQFGRLRFKRFPETIIGIPQRLRRARQHIGRYSLFPPQDSRIKAAVGMTAAHHQHIDGIFVQFIKFLHAVNAVVILD